MGLLGLQYETLGLQTLYVCKLHRETGLQYGTLGLQHGTLGLQYGTLGILGLQSQTFCALGRLGKQSRTCLERPGGLFWATVSDFLRLGAFKANSLGLAWRGHAGSGTPLRADLEHMVLQTLCFTRVFANRLERGLGKGGRGEGKPSPRVL